jgi:hypothetical protein
VSGTEQSIGGGAASQTLTSSSTVTVAAGLVPVTSSAAVTGLIVAAGTLDGQVLGLLNTGSYVITMAASGTSNVADGTVEVIPPGGLRFYVWSGAESLWYPSDGATANAVGDTEQFVALTTTYTLTNTTALQKLFNASSTGAVTVAATTSYFFECEFDLSSMATASGGLSFGFGGTATLTSVKYTALTQKSATALTTPTTPQFVEGTTATATPLVATTTGTGLNTALCRIRGIVRVNATGTLIPEVALGVGTTAVVGTNSYFRCWPVGSNTVTDVGSWS